MPSSREGDESGTDRDAAGARWKAIVRVFIFGLVMDAIYQFIVLRWFYPGEALITAFILAFVPYLLIRGPVNRIARAWNQKTAGSGRNS